ncbi:MAG: PAS domain S-box protein [candidate division Zixibacteria bacterium]|nr:PAS domain S-box protein [candidate division Zixibacteria bacterium]
MNIDKKRFSFKALFSKQVAGSYETELKTALLLILLFLILISFSSLRISGKLASIYREDNYMQLADGAEKLIDYVHDDIELKRSALRYRDLMSSTIVVRAAYLRAVDLQKMTAKPDNKFYDDQELVRAYYASLTSRKQGELEEGEMVRCGFGEGRDADKIAVLYPFRDADGVHWIGLFFKNASGLKLVNTVMKYNYLFQVAGLLAVLLVAYAYLKLTLNPFKRIADEARKVKDENRASGESVEEIVETFKATIVSLEEKEERLQELYNNSQKRADRLEKFNQYILESMLSGLIGVDNEGRVIHLNRSARNILGLDEDEIERNSYRETFAAMKPLVKILDGILENKAPAERLEQKHVRSDGKEKVLGISGSPVYDHKGRLVGAILLLADLTEVRRLQTEIAFKEKMAAVGEMSAGLAHEMRNAMMAIVGYSKILKKGVDDKKQVREIALSIAVESENCETMLKRFLSFAKPAALTPEPLSPAEMGNSVIGKLEPLADKKQVSIVDKFSESLPDLICDRTAVDQIMTNLLKNAIEASPEKGLVYFSILHNAARNSVTIEIEDSGSGIPEENRIKVFSPFFTTKDDGTGLGLSIVKKLVSSMGGSVEIDTGQENGCVFRVEIAADYLESDKPAMPYQAAQVPSS